MTNFRWWVENLKSSEGGNVIFPWQDKFVITASIGKERTPFNQGVLPLQSGETVATIAHWCRDNCKEMWRIGAMDEVYFASHQEAVLFLMSFSQSNSLST